MSGKLLTTDLLKVANSRRVVPSALRTYWIVRLIQYRIRLGATIKLIPPPAGTAGATQKVLLLEQITIHLEPRMVFRHSFSTCGKNDVMQSVHA